MPKTILVTGGAGFIGSHLVDRLIEQGHRVRILDNLEPQIHPKGKPDYLNLSAEFILGDVRDREVFARALGGIDAVFHFAAAVGTGQSMYQIKKYVDVNVGGLANLLDILVETQSRPKIVFPGSATSYGECAHRCRNHGMVFPELRSTEQLERKQWDVLCPTCSETMEPVPIPETQPLCPKFVYGLNKKKCEELLRAVAEAYELPFTILRFFNVYGPRQSLSNPYTGVIPIFSSRIKNGKPPLVIEDGRESRDFISVYDIVSACVAVLENDTTNSETYNVGTGRPIPILQMAELLLKLHGSDLKSTVNEEFRKHDFRHSIADITKLRAAVGFSPIVQFEDGLRELTEWTKDQEAVDQFDRAYNELRERGMVKQSSDVNIRPLVAVIILNWNGFADTVECVEGLQQSSYPSLKIIVVDNGSKNHEAEKLEARFGDQIVLVKNEANLGVSGGNNSGLNAALSDPRVKYCVMMNNDLIVAPNAIEELVSRAESDSRVGMVASRMMNYYHRDNIDNLGIFLLRSGLGYNRKSQAMPVFCPCSGFGLYRAEALKAIALPDGEIWDTDFFAYVDELDVGFRVRMAGYTADYAHDAVAYHKEGVTSGGSASDFTLYHGHRNNVWFLCKDFTLSLLLKNVFGILATQLGTFLLYAKRGRLKLIMKAKYDALRALPRMLKKRRFIQKNRKVTTSTLERAMLRHAYLNPQKLHSDDIQ